MYWYTIGQTLTPQERAPAPEQPAVVLLTSEELSHQPELPGLERTLHHTPPAPAPRGAPAASDHLMAWILENVIKKRAFLRA